MSGITLSASVRQNLLSLQSTADLLSTTQNRLATGNKVNTALDNPTNFFTAQSLNNRASDINNLLDGIGNGVQVIQAANTGITSLQKLVDSAKSIANQALQATTGYTKSNVSSVASGATATDLLGVTAAETNSATGAQKLNNATAQFSNAVVAGASVVNATAISAFTANSATGAVNLQDSAGALVSGTTSLDTGTTPHLDPAVLGILSGKTLTINGNAIQFSATATATTVSGNNTTIGLNTGTASTVEDIRAALQRASGTGATAALESDGTFTLTTGTAANITIGGTADSTAVANALGIASVARGGGTSSTPQLTGATLLSGAAVAGGAATLGTGGASFTTADTISVNGKTISFHAGSGTTGSAANGDLSIGLTNGTISSVLSAIDAYSGATGSTVTNGRAVVNTGTVENLVLGGSIDKLGLPAPVNPATTTTTARLSTPVSAAPISGTTTLSGAVGTNSLTDAFAVNDKISVNGTVINFVASGATGNDVNITDSVDTLLGKIDAITGGTHSVSGGRIKLNAGTLADIQLAEVGGGSVLGKLGLSAQTIEKSKPSGTSISGQTLTIGATGTGGVATTITFGTADNQVNTLDELNRALASNNLQASVSTTGQIKITTTNDAASSNIGVLGGTATEPGGIFSGVQVNDAVGDAASQATRASFVTQFNQVIDNIRTTAQDSSFNGVNLLNGDTLSLTFNETGKSKLDISGVSFGPDGLGLSALKSGTDFIDNASTNKVLASLTAASTALRSQASAFGSNLSIVQMRQDFSKNLINVLQTGASNLTLADTNEEAANSQALSTRQSIAVSSLALANQSQQGVLQLLR